MDHLIIRIYLQNLKNETHVEFNENINRIFIKYTPQALGFQALYDLYRASFLRELEALDFIRGSELTRKINRQDHARDTIYRGLVDTVHAGLNHFDPAFRDAALKIENIIRHYGNISRKTLDDETAAIDNLLRELQQPAFSAAVTLIGIAPWKDRLAQENEILKQLMTERYGEVAFKTPYRMKSTRLETDRYYHAILNRLEGEHLAGIPVNTEFIRDLNAVIERFKHILAQEIGEHKSENIE